MKSLTPSRSSYVLLTLGLMFTVGAAVRFLPSNLAIADEASAAGHPDADKPPHPAPAPQQEAVTAPEPTPIDQVCFSDETAALLAEDQKNIEAQQDALHDKELSLQEREQKLDARAAELDALRQTLEDRWEQMQAVSDEDLDHLAKMYSSMKPDQAAGIFNQMEPDFAAGFLRVMKSEQAGLILASMETRKAYSVSLKLAEKNEDVRTSEDPVQ
ncbi:MAG: hypothetical protein R3C00_08395 [Hyphomonas sp.]|nr:hypothetical protein [Hyphomonas sp.]